ncbi:unnamed protein product [Angiostrongylus costaricensis]|uniref:Density-regulated protein n=1 Tax=Angiostrongylus costaricensis TaxID=334426 RepID=A0A0R3PWV7_ANGCS|nr:unnamed protein product [Angiostrongylus costaricensis]
MSASGDADVVSCGSGPLPDVSYPLKVIYCGECSMPLEYCEYSGITDKCRKWSEEHAPEALNGIEITSDYSGEKKHQKRGGKGIVKVSVAADKKKPAADAKVTVQREPRGKKSVTVIRGLAIFDIDLKQASKLFAQKFACGSSVTGVDEIVIQGDVKDDLFDIIPSKWPQVPASKRRSGPGENGAAVYLEGNEWEKGQEQLKTFFMNVLASDKVSLDRSIPDSRPRECLSLSYPSDLPTASVVIVFTNEFFSCKLFTYPFFTGLLNISSNFHNRRIDLTDYSC